MLQTVEDLFFSELGATADADATKVVFILGAPRTGSTTIYKAMATFFDLPYIANITNDQFNTTPIIGMAAQKAMPTDISWSTRYGKTKGGFQPSEGSAVLGNWFGGGHPSQITSNRIKDGMEEHFITSLNAIEKLFGAPLVVKNPWNCFRVKYLATALPKAQFIWLQRDLVETASSDLFARYVNQKEVNDWNSATPANYQKLQKRPPVEQVVENQFEFNKAISEDLEKFAKGRWINVWLEDFLKDREEVLLSVAEKFSLDLLEKQSSISINATEKEGLSKDEQMAIEAYVSSDENRSRFQNLIYNG